MDKRLTIGMATYDDSSGVYFTIQSLRMYHDLTDCEIVVVDNKGDKSLKDWCEYWGKGLIRYLYHPIVGTSSPRHRVFKVAKGEYVICIDCHVMLAPGSLDRLWEGDDLIHGALAYDDFHSYILEMKDEWRGEMWGVWADGVKDLPKEPFEIWGHGLGLFGCKKEAWLGFNDKFRGFGGEEGYIHEKYRQAGKKVMCLPWIRWCHRFGYNGKYPLNVKDRIRNYMIGFDELGLDPQPIYDHFGVNVVNKAVA